MNIKRIDDGEMTILELAGRLDATTAPDVEKSVDEILGSGVTRLIFHLADTEYISSAGLRVILKAAKSLYGIGVVALSSPQEAVREVLEMTGFDEIMTIYDTLDEAKEEVSKADI